MKDKDKDTVAEIEGDIIGLSERSPYDKNGMPVWPVIFNAMHEAVMYAVTRNLESQERQVGALIKHHLKSEASSLRMALGDAFDKLDQKIKYVDEKLEEIDKKLAELGGGQVHVSSMPTTEDLEKMIKDFREGEK